MNTSYLKLRAKILYLPLKVLTLKDEAQTAVFKDPVRTAL